MVKGSVQTKGGVFYTVIYYYDSMGNRKQKWQSTGLPVKGNKRRAEELLKERITEMEIASENEKNKAKDMKFSEFMSGWLAMIKSTVLITTYGSYEYLIKDRINPYFDSKNMSLQSITTRDIQEY